MVFLDNKFEYCSFLKNITRHVDGMSRSSIEAPSKKGGCRQDIGLCETIFGCVWEVRCSAVSCRVRRI